MIEYEKIRSDETHTPFHYTSDNLKFDMHLHKSYEFIYVYEGEINVHLENQIFKVCGGQGMLILPNQAHAYQTVNYSKSYLCVFAASYLYEFYEKTKGLSAVNPVFDFSHCHGQIIADLQTENSNYYLLKSCFYKILACFTENIKYSPRSKKINNFVQSILSYIQEHFSEDASLDDLAKQLGYDYNYLSNTINEIFQSNFLQLVNEYRINYAIHLLQHTSHSVTEISRLSGYNSIRTFNRNFLQIAGKTPKQARLLSPKKTT